MERLAGVRSVPRGSSGGPARSIVEVGELRSPVEFVTKSLKLSHPFNDERKY